MPSPCCVIYQKAEGIPPGDCAPQSPLFPSFLSAAVPVCVLTPQRGLPEDAFPGDCVKAAEGPGSATAGGGGLVQLEEHRQAGRDK